MPREALLFDDERATKVGLSFLRSAKVGQRVPRGKGRVGGGDGEGENEQEARERAGGAAPPPPPLLEIVPCFFDFYPFGRYAHSGSLLLTLPVSFVLSGSSDIS